MSDYEMRSVKGLVLLFAVLHKQLSRAAVSVLTSTNYDSLNSMEYGFNLRKEELFSFEAQSCSMVTLILHSADNTNVGIIHWQLNYCRIWVFAAHLTKIESTENCHLGHKEPPSCLQFWPYWIYWHRYTVTFGRGLERGRNVLGTVDGIKAPIKYMLLEGKAQWKLAINDQKVGSMYYSPLTMRNINITSSILRQKVAIILQLCAVECLVDKECMSFTYDTSSKICQPHSTNYLDLTNVQYSQNNGVNYYQITDDNLDN